MYILISIITLVLFLMIKKTNKKENIILWTALSLIIYMCFNIFTTLIFSIVNIKSTLANLAIAQVLMIIIFILVLKKRGMQKYYIKKADIIFSVILLISIMVIALIQYGFPFNIKYIVTDGATHYLATINFFNYSELGHTEPVEMINFSTFMTGAYVNCGILLKSLANDITAKNYYTVFVLFDLIVLFLSGQLFYFLISKKAHKKSEYILAYIFTAIYLLGYALNSTLSGFCYLSLGLDIILAIIIIMDYITKEDNIIILLTTSLLTLGLFFSYYFFVPVVYLSIFIVLIRKYMKKYKHVLRAKNIMEIIYVLIIPSILGIYYMFLKEIFTKKYDLPNEAIAIKGEIYSNLITNFVIFIPLIIIFIVHYIKNKKINMKSCILIFEIFFIILLGIGKKLDKVSDYYFYKAYYLLWIITICTSFDAILLIKRNKKIYEMIIYIAISIYIIGIIVFPGILNKSIYIYDIYNYNFSSMKDENILDYKYFEVLEYYNNNLEQSKYDIYMISSKMLGRARWLYALYQNPVYVFMVEEDSIENWLEYSKENYCIYAKRDFNQEPNDKDERYEVLFNNESGAILKRK